MIDGAPGLVSVSAPAANPAASTGPAAPATPAPRLPPCGRIRLRPTAAVPLLSLVLAAIYGGSIHYQSNAGYLVLALMASVALVALVATRSALTGIQVVARAMPSAVAGEELRGSLTVLAGAQALSAVRVILPELSPDELARIDALPAGGSAPCDFTRPARRRGVLSIARVRLATTAPLGLFRAAIDLPVSSTWLIYPRPLPLGEQERASAVANPAQRFGQGDFLGHRAWMHGDPQRHVDWRAVARGSPMLVKEYAGGLGDERTLRFDDDPDRDLESRLSRLAARVIAAEQSGAAFALVVPGITLPAGSGEAHYHACMGALAKVPG